MILILGWGYPVERNDQEIWFSIFHVLMGASAVAAALGYFAQAMILKDKNWFEVILIIVFLYKGFVLSFPNSFAGRVEEKRVSPSDARA